MSADNNSSLPLLLGITAVIVLCVGGGWFLLDRGDTGDADPVAMTAPEPALPVAVASDVADPPTRAADTDIDLRKARMAAQSDLLAIPGEQSALHFYSKVLAAQPDNDAARVEFDDVLNRIEQQVTSRLRAENFDDAFELASRVAEVEPDHPLVRETNSTLDERATDVAGQAIEAARAGNDGAANRLLASAAALPGQTAEYLPTLRESIAEIRKARQDAENARQRAARRAAEKARADWLARFNGAIEAGRLIAPAGDNARDYLAGDDVPADLQDELTGHLMTALLTAGRNQLDEGQLERAESMWQTAGGLDEENREVRLLGSAIHNAYVLREESRVRTLQELVRTKTAPARYPRRAEERGMSGWVDVQFTVTTSGTTGDVTVIESEPETIFDAAAVEAVQQWEFEPRVFRGETIKQQAMVRLAFRVE